MNRQKAILIRTTRAASQPVLNALRRWHSRKESPSTPIGSVRRRLELLLAATYGREIRIEDAEPPRKTSWIGRLASGTPAHLSQAGSLAASDGATIRLPGVLRDSVTLGTAASQYRLLAIEHAERITRGTAALVPGDDTPLERDLYLLAEAAAIDSTIARSFGGITASLAGARSTALARRPELNTLSPLEREVEIIACQLLSSAPDALPLELGGLDSAEHSLAWARDIARKLRADVRGPASRYRGIAPIAVWGTVRRAAPVVVRTAEDMMQEMLDSASSLDTLIEQESGAGSRGGGTRADESQQEPEPDSGDADDVEVEEGDRSGTVPETTSGTGAESPEFPRDHSTRDSKDIPENIPLDSGGKQSSEHGTGSAPAYSSTDYPEWDCNAGKYRPRGATVRIYPAQVDSSAWVDEMLSEHAALVRSVRQRFERLRARRVRLLRQRDGDELDLAACVRSLVDARTGHSADDRLYVAIRPARRALAITLLVDVSGSTVDPVSDTLSVIDVEKVALLLASEALDALGDRYSILTFSSHGSADVRMVSVKSFDERNGNVVRQRISAIAPEGKTRLGAAVRHATAQLAGQSVGHRLLLILSDGKPNDTDRYFEQYAAEDTRHAIFESRAQDVYPFCLTVDRDEASEYLSHIFGPAGHTTLRQPDQLPLALLQAVRQLIGS